MATAPSPARRALPATAAIAGIAVLMRLVYAPWYLNYDARYALLWAGDAVRGRRPDYGTGFAPTPHPLETAVSVLALPFGDGGDQLLVWIVLLAFGALGWLTYRLGAELFSPWVGAVTALVVLTRPAIERDALLGYQDVPFAALVVGAVLLEARRPRRGTAVLALLAVAGLMRPEAWVLAGLYLLYVWREHPSGRVRAGLVALTAAAPVLWALSDLVVTGDALHSLNGTAALAEEAGRRRRIEQAPYWTAQYFGYTLREPLVVGVPIGLLFAWRHRRREAALPLAVAAVMTLVFAAGPLFGLPLIGRYVRTPSVLLALFYGLAVCGWLLLPAAHAERRRWKAAGIAAAALSVLFLPWHVGMLDGLDNRLDRDGGLYRDLRTAARAPAVRDGFAACGGISAADHRPIPHLRYWLHGRPGTVGTIESGAQPLQGLLLIPRDTRRMRGFYQENFPGGRGGVARPPGYRSVYANRSWRVLAAPRCVRRPRA